MRHKQKTGNVSKKGLATPDGCKRRLKQKKTTELIFYCLDLLLTLFFGVFSLRHSKVKHPSATAALA
jgi:hypothetical protein